MRVFQGERARPLQAGDRLQRGKRDYPGIMLDHDLTGRCKTLEDRSLSASDIVEDIVLRISFETPILIHSMNIAKAEEMAKRLASTHCLSLTLTL